MSTKSMMVLDRNRAYATKTLTGMGISRDTLSQFRRETGIKPVMIGHNHWYQGSDLINWIFVGQAELTEPHKLGAAGSNPAPATEGLASGVGCNQ